MATTKNTTIDNTSIFARLFSYDKSKRKTTEIFFSPTLRSQLLNILDKKDFRQLSSLQIQEHGTRLVIVMARDHSYASLQLFDYIPYKFVEASPLYEFTGGNAENIFQEMKGNLK